MTNAAIELTLDDPQDDIFVLGAGLVAMSVCSPKNMAIEQVEKLANSKHSTGISSRWSKSNDEHFATGQANGCDCDQFPKTRRHWLLNC